jgi:hypothetical protein
MPSPKNTREKVRDERRTEKAQRRRQGKIERQDAHEGHVSDFDPKRPPPQFPSAYPDAPPAFDGIAKTLSRGL